MRSSGDQQTMARVDNTTTMLRFRLMSRLGLAEPLVRLQRRIDAGNRASLRGNSTARSVERA